MTTTDDNAVVLLVQPDRDDREMYTEFLRHEGFIPVPVSTASDALTVAPSAAIIVTGILLPGHMDGIELIARLKVDRRTKGIPVIVLTACAWETERERSVAAGCDLFLPKPCLPDLLVAEIRRLLSLRRVPKPQPARAPLATSLGHRRRS